FIENVYANQIAFGRLYREKRKEQGSQTIREAVGEDASLKSRDVAALDTRKSKQ
ncbi:hypothetical protein, partial [Shigella sonnei]|uniref:hypothetical protein n=1 Tax=Shigella sonnei TaxID=624 RepID=UPI003C6F9039